MTTSRITMNSPSLRKAFPAIYERFFGQCNLVVSGSFSMPWCPNGIGHRSHSIIVKNKIPLRCYVGFSARTDREVIFQESQMYHVSKREFESIPEERFEREYRLVRSEIRNFLDENGFTGGVDIHFISETARGHSLNLGETLCALISSGVHILTGKCTTESLSGLEQGSETFSSIFRFAWKMGYIMKYRNSIGQSIFSTLLPDNGLGFAFSEKFDSSIRPEQIDSIKVGYFDLEKEFAGEIGEIPVDSVIIFSGSTISTKQVEESRIGDIKKLTEYQDFIGETLLPKIAEHSNTPIHGVYNTPSLYNHLIESVEILNIKTLKYFEKFTQTGYDSYLVNEFIDHINDYRAAVSLIEKQSKFAEDFLYLFRKNRKDPDEIAGILPAYSGKLGGGYLVVMRPDISRETLEKTLEELREIYPNSALEYASYLDGMGGEPPKVEQYVTEGLYSNYLSDGSKILFKTFGGKKQILSHDEALESLDSSFIVDTIHKKMYYKGLRLTSKEISSQSATADLLELLAENSGKDVSSSDLPLSSYSRNKNEMIGKIISPLCRFYKEKTGQELPIRCSGGVMEFKISLGSFDIPMGIIKKIM